MKNSEVAKLEEFVGEIRDSEKFEFALLNKHKKVALNLFKKAVEKNWEKIVLSGLENTWFIQKLSLDDRLYVFGCAVLRGNKKIVSRMREIPEFVDEVDVSSGAHACVGLVFNMAVEKDRNSMVFFILNNLECVGMLSAPCKEISFGIALEKQDKTILFKMFEAPRFLEGTDVDERKNALEYAVQSCLFDVIRKMIQSREFLDGIPVGNIVKACEVLLAQEDCEQEESECEDSEQEEDE